MAIVKQGTVNTTAQIVPGLTVQIVPPKVANLNGVPTNRLLVEGTATWGPVNQPTFFSDMSSFEQNHGTLQNRKFDMGTVVATAVLQGANNFVGIRVADGSQAAAANTIANAVTVNAAYTGTYGNGIRFAFSAGSKANTLKATVTAPTGATEVYDNMPNSTAVWSAFSDGVNSGNQLYATRGAPSDWVSVTLGNATATPSTNVTYVLTGGADGASANASTMSTLMIGTDGINPTGMYAARKQGASVGVLADLEDTATFSTQAAFGTSEGIIMVGDLAAGTSINSAVAARSAVDDPDFWLFDGNKKQWLDTYNGLTRFVSNQGFAAGRLVNLSPEQSPLNKPVAGVIGAQKANYNDSELATLFAAGIDVLTNPAPGGPYWAVRGGINTSSNNATNGLNYSRMTNYIAATLNAGMGIEIGEVINDDTFADVTTSLEHFLSGLLNQGILGRQGGLLPYQVVCNAANNPPERTEAGYLYAKVRVRYQAITKFFIIDSEGGQTVTITVSDQ